MDPTCQQNRWSEGGSREPKLGTPRDYYPEAQSFQAISSEEVAEASNYLAFPLDKPLAADRIRPPRRTNKKKQWREREGVSYGTDLERASHP